LAKEILDAIEQLEIYTTSKVQEWKEIMQRPSNSEEQDRVATAVWETYRDMANRIADLGELVEKALGSELPNQKNKTKEANRWIPVTEKLPDNTESYYEEHGVYPKYLVIVRLSPDLPRIACFDGKRFCNGMYSYDVTHWRPLPEPPDSEVADI